MKSIGWIGVLAVLASVGISSVNAQDQVTKVATSSGALSVRAGTKPECKSFSQYLFACKVIELNGRLLFADSIAGIDDVYPKSTTPEVVFASTSNGGNCSTHPKRSLPL